MMSSPRRGRAETEADHRPVAWVGDSELVDKRRAQLVASATSLIAKQGFAGTTIRDIAQSAGMSSGLVYEYVRRKEDILFLIIEHGTLAWERELAEAMSVGPNEFVRVRNGFVRLAELTALHADEPC